MTEQMFYAQCNICKFIGPAAASEEEALVALERSAAHGSFHDGSGVFTITSAEVLP